ncbi:MAG: RNA polymerase sigma factor, RpoD/SigA family [Oscillatoria sp. SIO1A7]|nr:RNA polymerase sigma factor, RpoD/SigA family [Oscillatoria sp. SIO1A7]
MTRQNTKQFKQHPGVSTDTVRTYLHEIGRVPLLDQEQEIVLGKQVQEMMRLMEARNSREKELSCDLTQKQWCEIVELSESELRRSLQAGERAKRKMIEANLRLVITIAKKYQNKNLEFLDLIQEGTLGLVRAVEKFDPTLGYRFSTYAYWWINQAMRRAIAQQAGAIRLPLPIQDKLNKIKRAKRNLTQELGRNPTLDEIGTEVEIESEKIQEYLLMERQPISLELRIGDNQNTELQDLIEDENTNGSERWLQMDLEILLRKLKAREREVLTLRFGLGGEKPLSYAKIGRQLNMSSERVRRIQNAALAKLRQYGSSFKDYLSESVV